jgi:hypothetical protein
MPPATLDYGRRITRPDYISGYGIGPGVGVVPRRGWDSQTAAYIAEAARAPSICLSEWASTAPLRLLEVMCLSHPMAQMAIENDLSLAFAPGDTHIVAVENVADKEANEEGTAILDSLWASLRPEAGELPGLQATLALWVQVNGLPCVEAVAGPRGAGLADVLDFSPYSVRYKDKPGGRRVLQQKQPEGPDNGWRDLPEETVLAKPWRGNRDNPYGRPRLGAFLSEGLTDIGEQMNLKDILRAIAWPHIAFEFPVVETVKFLAESPNALREMQEEGEVLTPYTGAMKILTRFLDMLPNLKADDTITLPGGAKANVINAGAGLPGLEGTLKMRRLRVCQSLLQPPNMLGITDGGTMAYSEVQWKQYVQGLEALRAFVNSILLWVANLHLRLLGLPLIARADTKPIDSGDRLKDAQADEKQRENTFALVRAGMKSIEDASYDLTGSAVVDEARAEAFFALPAPEDNQQQQQGSGGQGAKQDEEAREEGGE